MRVTLIKFIKCPFLRVEVVGPFLRVGAYSRGYLFNNFPDRLGAHSSGARLRGGGALTWGFTERLKTYRCSTNNEL